MSTEAKKWSTIVKDREAAERIAAAYQKMKRNPVIEEVADGFRVSWDNREVRK